MRVQFLLQLAADCYGRLDLPRMDVLMGTESDTVSPQKD